LRAVVAVIQVGDFGDRDLETVGSQGGVITAVVGDGSKTFVFWLIVASFVGGDRRDIVLADEAGMP
jgi:hypothetical protein